MAIVKPLYMNASTGYHQEASPTSDTFEVPSPQTAASVANRAYVDAVAAADTYAQGNGITIGTGNVISVALATQGGLGFNGALLSVALATNSGLTLSASGLSVLLADTTLSATASGLAVAALPANPKIGGTSTTGFTAANLNTLTNGGDASALHTHTAVAGAQMVAATYATSSASALAIGDPVFPTATANTVGKCDPSADATSRVIGVAGAAIAANSNGTIVSLGIVKNALTSATIGADVWLKASGGLTQTKPTTAATRIVRVGYAVSATDLFVQITDQGRTAG